jgi:tetraacyldisaccharide 4'-kinase
VNTFLLPFSWLYSLVLSLRRFWLRRQDPVRLAVPVISVGNITVGGTGKTELVAMLCQHLQDLGWKPGIVSRGYRRKTKEAVVVVSSGQKGPEVSVQDAGDEPYLLATRLPNVPVVVSTDRISAGKIACQQFGCTVLVLDDGFQRRYQVARDLDIVLLDAADPFGGSQLLPAGRLREPIAHLHEADCLVLTRADQYTSPSLLARIEKQFFGKAFFTSRHAPKAVVLLSDGSRQPLEYLINRRVVAVSGIGRPESFVKTLTKLGAQVVGQMRFPDHHWYTETDCQRAQQQAERLQAELIMTTKDAVRFGQCDKTKLPGCILEVGFEFLTPTNGFLPYLQKRLNAWKKESDQDEDR